MKQNYARIAISENVKVQQWGSELRFSVQREVLSGVFSRLVRAVRNGFKFVNQALINKLFSQTPTCFQHFDFLLISEVQPNKNFGKRTKE